MAAMIGRSHHYADFTFATHATRDPAPVLVSTIKLRQAGFGDCVDTETMFARQLADLQARGMIPTPEDMARIPTFAKGAIT